MRFVRILYGLSSVVALLGACALGGSSGAVCAEEQPHLRHVQSIPLPGVEGRIDHLALDRQGGRMFVAALGSGTVEVIDLRSGIRTQRLQGFREPQGLWFVSNPARLFVSTAGDGACAVLDATTLTRLRTVELSGDADNIRYDARTGRAYVGCGEGRVAILDGSSGEWLGSIPLPGHPEAFQLDSGGSRIFVNVPESKQVVVAELLTRKVTEHWKLGDYQANFPMALDEAGARLFVGCRRPPALLLLDTRSGLILDTIPIAGDCDDLFFDTALSRLFAICGEGVIDILVLDPNGQLSREAAIPTAPGARTGFYDPGSRRLYVAIPHRGTQSAEIRIFEYVP